jgi:hypothetical protein
MSDVEQAIERAKQNAWIGTTGEVHDQAVVDRKVLAAEVERLQAIVDALPKLLEVAEDMRAYTHDWDWKYGEYWDNELAKAAEHAAKAQGGADG